MLNDGGKLDEKRFTAFGEFIGMLNQYTDPALITGSYDEDRIVTNSTGNEPLNAFLEKYPHILQLYKNNDLTREAYDAVVESFLSQLDDSEDIPF